MSQSTNSTELVLARINKPFDTWNALESDSDEGNDKLCDLLESMNKKRKKRKKERKRIPKVDEILYNYEQRSDAILSLSFHDMMNQ